MRLESVPASPLYAVSTPREVQAELRYGNVDRRFERGMHPILEEKGLPPELWAGLLRDVQAAPRVSWAEFSALPKNAPRLWWGRWFAALAGSKLAGLAMNAMEPWTSRRPGPPPWIWIPAIAVVLAALASAGAVLLVPLVYLARWVGRPFDEKRIGAMLAEYAWRFDAYGVGLGLHPDAPHVVVVNASLTDEEVDRKRDEAARKLEADRRERERVLREEEEARRWKRALRDAYYLDRGVKPGPTAWFRILPDWVQAILMGVAGGVSIVLTTLAVFALARVVAG